MTCAAPIELGLVLNFGMSPDASKESIGRDGTCPRLCMAAHIMSSSRAPWIFLLTLFSGSTGRLSAESTLWSEQRHAARSRSGQVVQWCCGMTCIDAFGEGGEGLQQHWAGSVLSNTYATCRQEQSSMYWEAHSWWCPYRRQYHCLRRALCM
jgi:hypothetical protein